MCAGVLVESSSLNHAFEPQGFFVLSYCIQTSEYTTTYVKLDTAAAVFCMDI